MNILDGIKNFLQLINDNWTLIICIIGIAMALWRKIKSYINLSNDEKIEVVKDQISVGILKFITDAEEDYSGWVEAGAIKRSQVIDKIFKEYPILEKVTDRNALIEWLDDQIDNALITLRSVIAKNTSNKSNQEEAV